jgi:hypothetical protein
MIRCAEPQQQRKKNVEGEDEREGYTIGNEIQRTATLEAGHVTITISDKSNCKTSKENEEL